MEMKDYVQTSEEDKILDKLNLPTIKPLICYDADEIYPVKIYVDRAVDYLLDVLHVVAIKETNQLMYYFNGKYHDNGNEVVRHLLVRCFHNILTEEGDCILDRKVIEEIVNKITHINTKSITKFDNNIDIINMKNGLFNWKTGEFYKHTPDYYSTIQIPIEYNPDADCPIIKEVLSDIVDKKYYWLCLEFIAYLLYKGYDIQKSIILFGPGQTGKSWYLDLCKNFVGLENCSAESMQALSHDKFSPANLFRKLLNECGDLDATTLKATGTFKKLSSKDTLSIQRKFENAFPFNNFAKLLFATNILPKVDDKTTGFFRRIIIILFLRVFREDEYDENRVNANSNPSELSGLFNLVIPLLKPLLDSMKFNNAPTTDEVIKLYNSAANTISIFAEENLIEEPSSYIPKERMYEAYKRFCCACMATPVTKNTFAKELQRECDFIKSGSRTCHNKRFPAWLNVGFI